MDQILFTVNEQIPVVEKADVLVVGGGPGGLGAAVMAARMGAKVVLAERYGLMGGMANSGEVTPFMYNHLREKDPNDPNGGEKFFCMDRPVYLEWVRKMAESLPDSARKKLTDDYKTELKNFESHTISKDYAALAAEKLCLEAGVKIYYHFDLVKAIMDNGSIKAAVFATKSGFAAIEAKSFVDATGDADLTVLAGGKADFGGPAGHCQPMTLCFKMNNVDFSRIPSNLDHELWDKAKAEGKIHCPRENLLKFPQYIDDGVMHFNTTRVVMKSAVNAIELSEAEVEVHQQVREITDWLIHDVPGFENAKISSMGSHIGVRESRRIQGIKRINRDTFTNHVKYPDGIARCNYNIDIHNPTGAGTEFERLPGNEYYEIPYGCIVPAGIKNLTVGGRPISVDHAVHSSSRVMPPAISVGQAAGVACAMSVQTGINCCDLDGVKVREQLKKMGAWL